MDRQELLDLIRRELQRDWSPDHDGPRHHAQTIHSDELHAKYIAGNMWAALAAVCSSTSERPTPNWAIEGIKSAVSSFAYGSSLSLDEAFGVTPTKLPGKGKRREELEIDAAGSDVWTVLVMAALRGGNDRLQTIAGPLLEEIRERADLVCPDWRRHSTRNLSADCLTVLQSLGKSAGINSPNKVAEIWRNREKVLPLLK